MCGPTCEYFYDEDCWSDVERKLTLKTEGTRTVIKYTCEKHLAAARKEAGAKLLRIDSTDDYGNVKKVLYQKRVVVKKPVKKKATKKVAKKRKPKSNDGWL